jgi:hypothetical protein
MTGVVDTHGRLPGDRDGGWLGGPIEHGGEFAAGSEGAGSEEPGRCLAAAFPPLSFGAVGVTLESRSFASHRFFLAPEQLDGVVGEIESRS